MIVKDSVMELSTPTGPMRTYFYEPAELGVLNKKRPALLFYSEIFQQTPSVRRLALQFASLGYLVLVPEIYHAYENLGCVLGYDEVGKNRGNDLKQIIPMSEFDNDAKAMVKALKNDPRCDGKIGAVGICLGGHLAFRAALLPEILATACFYPTDLHTGTLGKDGNADSLARASEIKGELLMVFGRQDPHISTVGRHRIYQALDQAKVWFTWHEFNASHAFLRDEGERYDPVAARTGISLAADLMRRNM